ncbi:chromosome segregation protein SMC [Pseudidiomarina marina]|uniref:Chromosome partition protein Smc n=1 Tax=Pseudidiomarina marina TaxID=502366 RepID=A0A432YIV2_9GAMM|nr:chromosome segregation protein SMC [Pseudidiomarina marina]RUO60828.1 chromosome segregation protein SMC [Pseudidiomarina marina]
MRLKHIKLVGFKSFVDPTKVPFPHQMTCVVGPNGCGKSNVIDAVRWVLGESSAKNLRGDAMTDVIFNGSSSRKPVSQASVELVFDNASGRIQGEYANYAEISVKRLVTRDGRSDYFLNNSKCRRRDITDLFLGTGLGPRSYAIIEQGMISRLIESKPQELRIFIEEAAGISKYKERRRETENRMQHTRDNLDRLNDVRDELGSQLDKLQRQAAAARRYKDLKAQERKYKAELQALRWLAQEQQAEQIRATIREQETELERWLAEQRGSERGTLELREQAEETKQKLDAIQQQFYQLGNDITRHEHELQGVRQQQQQREQRRHQLQAELTQLEQTLQDDKTQWQELEQQREELAPEVELAEQQLQETQARLELEEQAWLQWQDDYQIHLNELQRQRDQQQQVQLQQQRVDHQIQRHQDELQRTTAELIELQQQLAEVSDTKLQQQTDELSFTREELQEQLRETDARIAATVANIEQLNVQRDQLQSTQQQLIGRQSSLEHLLQAAQAEDWPTAVRQWLLEQGIEPLGQVRELFQVNADWQLASEQVVGDWLDAWVLKDRPQHWPNHLGAKLVVLQNEKVNQGSLAEQVSGPLRHWQILNQISCSGDTNAAADVSSVAMINQLGQRWSIAGYQAPQVAAENSQIAQQQELQTVVVELDKLEQQLMAVNETLAQAKSTNAELQQLREQQREQLSEIQGQLLSCTEKLQWQQRQRDIVVGKQHDLEERQVVLKQKLEELQVELQELSEQHELLHEPQQHSEDGDWQERRAQLQAARQQAQNALNVAQKTHQELMLQAQQIESQRHHLQTLMSRIEAQQQQTQEQLKMIGEPDVDSQEQLEMLALQLEELIQRREQVDEERREWANRLSEQEAQIREISSGAQGVQGQIEKVRAKLQSSQMELAALQERTRNVLAVLQEMQQPLKPVLEQLSEEADEKAWQAELERLQNSIQRLGAINLAAIEEAEVLAERKEYLDQQHEDLSSSLETLETAIRKIDKETRQRFRATYDAVNSGLQELFPKVFGGGSAYLELTDDDLLETGVTIMARPPGKKNSTIHLLSGGEKALTALSLVFAIFRLNPAPFCLLDEVDAPLDDANVGRFCRLVEEMSATVQFIYISHNKVAMEMASHLAGVTMQEAGVSRLVAVDIDEAVALTEAS